MSELLRTSRHRTNGQGTLQAPSVPSRENFDHVLVIEGGDNANAFYLITTGRATNSNPDQPIDTWATNIPGTGYSLISGLAHRGTREFFFDGEVVDAELGDGNYTATLDGETVDTGRKLVKRTNGDSIVNRWYGMGINGRDVAVLGAGAAAGGIIAAIVT